MLDGIKEILELIRDYGADTVFMVMFFLLFRKANKKVEIIQEKRIEDSRKAIQALIEAKQVFTEMHKQIEDISEHLTEHIIDESSTFAKMSSKLDQIHEDVKNEN